jgi:hypothetical protein
MQARVLGIIDRKAGTFIETMKRITSKDKEDSAFLVHEEGTMPLMGRSYVRHRSAHQSGTGIIFPASVYFL